MNMQDFEDLKGKVLQGTCGWSDSSILKCGRFYPLSVKTTEDRLLHYSRFFPCVECDSSNYAIPSPAAVEKWIKCVPAGFKFHFKAFGFFTRKVRLRFWNIYVLKYTKVPSTRIRIFLNPQFFLSGYGYRPHAYGEFASKSGNF